MRKYFFIAVLLLYLPASIDAQEKIKVNIKWEYKNVDGIIDLYEIKGQPGLWETKAVKSLADAPIGENFANPSFELKPGDRKRFALVMKNGTDKQISFFASPHIVHPVEHSLGFKFKCLCINHAFSIPPKWVWYRIVELRLHKEFVGSELMITHSIIGIDSKRAESFSKTPALPDL